MELRSRLERPIPPLPPLKMQVWQGKDLLRKSAQFVRSWSALCAKVSKVKRREGGTLSRVFCKVCGSA